MGCYGYELHIKGYELFGPFFLEPFKRVLSILKAGVHRYRSKMYLSQAQMPPLAIAWHKNKALEGNMGVLTTEISNFVKKQKLGFVATVCPDGTPNLSPKGTTTVWDDNHLVFADIHSPGTIQNLLKNPAVEVNVVDVFTRKGYRFKGRGKVLSEGRLFEKAVELFRNAGARYYIHHIVLIEVQSLFPILSPVYDTGISEEDVLRRWTSYWNDLHPFT